MNAGPGPIAWIRIMAPALLSYVTFSKTFFICKVGAGGLAPGAEWGGGHLVRRCPRLCTDQLGSGRKVGEALTLRVATPSS